MKPKRKFILRSWADNDSDSRQIGIQFCRDSKYEYSFYILLWKYVIVIYYGEY